MKAKFRNIAATTVLAAMAMGSATAPPGSRRRPQ